MIARGAPVDVGIKGRQRVCRAAGELPLRTWGPQLRANFADEFREPRPGYKQAGTIELLDCRADAHNRASDEDDDKCRRRPPDEPVPGTPSACSQPRAQRHRRHDGVVKTRLQRIAKKRPVHEQRDRGERATLAAFPGVVSMAIGDEQQRRGNRDRPIPVEQRGLIGSSPERAGQTCG